MQFDLEANAPDLALYLPETLQLQNNAAIPIALQATGEVTPAVWYLETLEIDFPQAVIVGDAFLERDGDEFINSHVNAKIEIATLAPLFAAGGQATSRSRPKNLCRSGFQNGCSHHSRTRYSIGGK